MNKKEILSIGIFLVSIFLLGFIFFLSMDTQIKVQVEGGKAVLVNVPINFSLISVLFLMALSIIATASLIYFLSDISKSIKLSRKQKLSVELLENDEKKVYLFLLEREEILQKDLVYELQLSKSKVTRILDKLEHKKLLVRVSYGKTNKIRVV